MKERNDEDVKRECDVPKKNKRRKEIGPEKAAVKEIAVSRRGSKYPRKRKRRSENEEVVQNRRRNDIATY